MRISQAVVGDAAEVARLLWLDARANEPAQSGVAAFAADLGM